MSGASGKAVETWPRLTGVRHVVTIGNFDGIHRGHQHLLSRVTARAKELNVPSLVVTFEPHPATILRPEHAPPRIATPEEKFKRLHAAGIDEVVAIPFDRAFAALSPEEFLTLVADNVCPTDVYVGAGFRFGKMRAGDIGTIQQFGNQHGFDCHTVEPLSDEDGVISSSRLRASLLAGNVAAASKLLGRRYRLAGEVEHGMARGKDLGYPTANLNVPDGLCVPQDGIYAGYGHFDSQSNAAHEALIYIGTSPTFGDRPRLVEVNILDFRGDLYGRGLEIEFVELIRGDQTFDTTEALITQMAQDETKARQVLSDTAPEPDLRGS
ncbi:bifunctional riboflavin kinase/FAD synthetase [soil metagenome]